MGRIDIMGIPVDNISLTDALKKIEIMVRAGSPSYMAFLNLSQIVFCKENEKLLEYYKKAEMVLVDGTNVTRLTKLLKQPIIEKIYGNDFIYEVCKVADKNNFSVFFLGGSPSAAEYAVENIKKVCKNLKIAGIYAPPYGFENDDIELSKINTMLSESKADIVFVGFGSPKQDMFINNFKHIYNIPVSIPIGSGIDITGDIYKRAPRWISDFGFEWLYRCFLEPRRLFKRYIFVGVHFCKHYWKYKKRM